MRVLAWPCVILLMWGAALCSTPTQSQVDSSLSTPSVQATLLAYRYPNPRGLRSIRDVDFRNLRVVVFDAKGKPTEQFPLRNGWLERSRAVGGDEVDIGEIYYFKGPHDTTERALVELGWTSVGGSSSNTGILLVFAVRGGNLFATQQITYDMHAPGTLDKFYPEGRVLVVLGRTADDSPHCCPNGLTEVTFEWNGKEFQIRSVEKLLLEKKGSNASQP